MSASKKRPTSSSSSSSSPTGQTKRARFGSDTKESSTDPAAQENETMNTWQVEEEIAESMIPIIGKMYRRENVVLTLFNHTLSNLSTLDLIKIHAVTRDHRNRPIKITDTWPIVEALSHRRLKPMRIDVGALSVLVKKAQITGKLLSVSDEIGKYISKSEAGAVRENPMDSARDVVLFGFGRIGRLLARLLIEKTGTGSKLRLRAIVVRKKKVPDLYKRANLLMTDSVHGRYKGSVVVDEARNALICNGNTVHLIYADGPDRVDYEGKEIVNILIVFLFFVVVFVNHPNTFLCTVNLTYLFFFFFFFSHFFNKSVRNS
jgi:glyceraldehyde 3-phosphate dehydrogenase